MQLKSLPQYNSNLLKTKKMKTKENRGHIVSYMIFLAATLYVMVMQSCNKEETPDSEGDALKGIALESRSNTTLAIIRGGNFGTDIQAVKVFIGDKEAVVREVEDSAITIAVPPGYSGSVSVWVNGHVVLGAVLEYLNSKIQVSTVVGPWYDKGSGALVKFKELKGMAVDKQGKLYVINDHKIVKITPKGTVAPNGGLQGTRYFISSVAKRCHTRL